ncbi:MAG TPA: sigma-70 family RNA polymerase sigma factor [Candidatus Acidoferrum sp.]
MTTQFVSKTQMTEESLIRAGQRGDAQALNTLFHRHQRTLFRSALGIMGNPQDAEDALQDGLLSAFRNLRNFEGRSQFSTWLTRVVTNAALMRRRSQAVRPSATAVEPINEDELPIVDRLMSKGLNPEQLLGGQEIREIIKDHIHELAPILRTAFVLRKVREYSTGETAKVLRVSEQTLKGRLLRARRALGKRLSRTLLQSMSAPPDHEYEP